MLIESVSKWSKEYSFRTSEDSNREDYTGRWVTLECAYWKTLCRVFLQDTKIGAVQWTSLIFWNVLECLECFGMLKMLLNVAKWFEYLNRIPSIFLMNVNHVTNMFFGSSWHWIRWIVFTNLFDEKCIRMSHEFVDLQVGATCVTWNVLRLKVKSLRNTSSPSPFFEAALFSKTLVFKFSSSAWCR